jgi:uncharacterized protein YjiS (DUF1127 family)
MRAVVDVTGVTPQTSPRGWARVVAPVQQLVRSCSLARRRRAGMAELAALSDRELWDIGIVRSEIESVVRFNLGEWR